MVPPESWIPFFDWCEATFLGVAVRDSIWMFPVIESVHLTALCLMGGTLLLVDLRLLGFGLSEVGIDELVRHVRPWFAAGLAIMLSTGVLLFLSEAIKCFYNTSFWVKMITLPIALLFTLLVRNRAALSGLDTSIRSRLLGSASLILWVTVAAAGRWIGYS